MFGIVLLKIIPEEVKYIARTLVSVGRCDPRRRSDSDDRALLWSCSGWSLGGRRWCNAWRNAATLILRSTLPIGASDKLRTPLGIFRAPRWVACDTDARQSAVLGPHLADLNVATFGRHASRALCFWERIKWDMKLNQRFACPPVVLRHNLRVLLSRLRCYLSITGKETRPGGRIENWQEAVGKSPSVEFLQARSVFLFRI